MENFSFRNPVKIIFGKDRIRALVREIPASSRVLLLYGMGSIQRNGVHQRIHECLAGHATVLEFGGIEPNPDFDLLCQAVDLARREKVDFLLAAGGGSVLDGTKFVAAATRFGGADPWELVAGLTTASDALPMGAVLTFPATGSEMNSTAVISRRRTQEKLEFSSPALFPRFSILDPDATVGLERHHIAHGVIDAFVHTAEQYLTKPVRAPLQDRFAEGVFMTIIEEGTRAYMNLDDFTSRANFMWAATMALNGLISCGVPTDWSTHAIGHELTALTGLDHARTLAVILPALLTVKFDARKVKLAQFATRVWGIQDSDEADRAWQAISATRAFFESLEVPTHLAGHGIEPDVCEQIIVRLTRRGAFPLGGLDDITERDARAILDLAGTACAV